MRKKPESYVKDSGIWIDGAADVLSMPTVERYNNSLILVFEEGISLSRQHVESILTSMSATGIDYFIIRLRNRVRDLNAQMSEIFDDPNYDD